MDTNNSAPSDVLVQFSPQPQEEAAVGTFRLYASPDGHSHVESIDLANRPEWTEGLAATQVQFRESGGGTSTGTRRLAGNLSSFSQVSLKSVLATGLPAFSVRGMPGWSRTRWGRDTLRESTAIGPA